MTCCTMITLSKKDTSNLSELCLSMADVYVKSIEPSIRRWRSHWIEIMRKKRFFELVKPYWDEPQDPSNEEINDFIHKKYADSISSPLLSNMIEEAGNYRIQRFIQFSEDIRAGQLTISLEKYHKIIEYSKEEEFRLDNLNQWNYNYCILDDHR